MPDDQLCVGYRQLVRSVHLAAAILAILAIRAVAQAQSHTPTALLTDLVMPAGDDARKAIAIGPSGEVYEPDGKGAWVRERAITMADTVAVVGRANGVVALAGGAVYRLANNGWSAMRLVQKGKAVMSSGARSVAAVGRQLFALDKIAGGEVAKLAMAPRPVQLIGAGSKALTIQTDRGLLRAERPGAAWRPIARAPRRVDKLIDDRWALTDRGAVDLKTGNVTPWPSGFRLGAVTPGPKGTLLLVGTHRGAIEVVVIDGVKVTRETIDTSPDAAKNDAAKNDAAKNDAAKNDAAKSDAAKSDGKKNHTASDGTKNHTASNGTKNHTASDGTNGHTATSNGTNNHSAKRDAKPSQDPADAVPEIPRGPLTHPVGVVTDKSGRIVVAFRDGRIVVRERGAWSITAIVENLPAPRPGAPPATSP